MSEWIDHDDVVREFIGRSWKNRLLFYYEKARLRMAIFFWRIRKRNTDDGEVGG